MKILITGAAGFIGSHLSDALLSEGHEVVGVDNLSMGRMENLASAQTNKRFSFVKLDVLDYDSLEASAEGVERIVHLAAFKIPRYGNAIDTLVINNLGTVNILKLARKLDCKVVIASTSDVYGKSPALPFNEEGDLLIGAPTKPRWSYAVSKMYDEHLALASMEAYGFPVVLLRFFGSYGPRHHLSWWGGPQSVFIEKILRGDVTPIHGDGQQTRSFTFVADTVRGIVAATLKDSANGHVINIGSTREITIEGLARLIHSLIPSAPELRLEFIPYEDVAKQYEDVLRRIPDDTKCFELLGVRSQVSLEDGLATTIAWQRKELNL